MQGGKKANVWSPFGQFADDDPAWFALISGKLDAVAALRKEAAETKDSDQEKTKAVSDLLCANCRHTDLFSQAQLRKKWTGDSLRASLMIGHTLKCCNKHHLDNSDNSDKENADSSTLPDEGRSVGKRSCCLSCSGSQESLDAWCFHDETKIHQDRMFHFMKKLADACTKQHEDLLNILKSLTERI